MRRRGEKVSQGRFGPPGGRWLRGGSLLATAVFGLAIVVQGNDPDPIGWMVSYAIPAAAALAAFFGFVSVPISTVLAIAYLVAAWWFLPAASEDASLAFDSLSMKSLGVERMREALGLAIGSAWFWILSAIGGWRRLRSNRGSLLLALFLAGCAVGQPATLPSAPGSATAIDVPGEPARRIVARTVVHGALPNPRGILPLENGGLLVSVAGAGESDGPGSGGLLRLQDHDRDGRFDGEGETIAVLGEQPSSNVISIVRRDEVFGMADIAQGGGSTLVSLARFGGPSLIYRLDADGAVIWSRVHGNINDLEYDPRRASWFAVSSSSDEIVRLQPGRGSTRILKVPPLALGQDPVPGYLRHDRDTGDLLVTLFSGSPRGEEGGTGIEIEPGAGGIVRVDPDTGEMSWLVRGLTAPTDLGIGADGRIYVLELCSQFQDPVSGSDELWAGPSHGGFRRFSGRLLAIDRTTREVEVLAEGLDAPTNLALRGRELFIAQGMGTPGRLIPGPGGPVPLTGFIEKLELPLPNAPL